MENIDRHDGILVIEVPHQGAPTASSWLDRAEFEDSLRERVAGLDGGFTQWLHDNFEVPDGDDDGLSAIEALENDIENVIGYWNHDFHSTYVFDDRDEAAAMLSRLEQNSGGNQKFHGQLAISGALRAWLSRSEGDRD